MRTILNALGGVCILFSGIIIGARGPVWVIVVLTPLGGFLVAL